MKASAGTAALPPKRQLPRDERQAQLLRAAATAFADAGYAATSMDDVARHAGITKLIVYRHFASKEELYRAVLEQVASRLGAEFRAEVHDLALEQRRPGFATLALLRVARQNPDGFSLLTRHAIREPEFRAVAQGFFDDATRVADAMLADFVPDTAVRAWAAPVMVDYLVQGVLTWLDVGAPDCDDDFVVLATTGLRGLVLAWADRDHIPDKVREVLARELVGAPPRPS